MKKFVIAAAMLALLGLWMWYAFYYQGFYIDLNPSAPVTVQFKARGKDLYMRGADGAWQPFQVRGVVLNSSLPGFLPTDHQPDEAMYLHWMEQIGELGANTIRVYTVMDDAFYNALHTYNTSSRQPLYLLQSIRVTDQMNNSAGDAYDMGFAQSLLRDAMDVVDVIHGRKNIALNNAKGSGTYRKDVSAWVLGFIVGQEWNAATIAYTDHRGRPSSYAGEYIRTKEGATAFEAMLARVMDRLASYESRKYKAQRLISFINDPQHDPFAYEQQYAKRIAKFSQLDIEQIEGTELFEPGLFAAYRAYVFCPNFWAYLSKDQLQKLSDISSRVDRGLYYEGYTQLLAEYHTMPVVIVSYGYSSARGIDSLQYGDRLTERRQGEMLVKAYDDIVASGCSGAVISGFADNWGQRTWNTSYAVELTHAQMWHDLQTNAQGNGLLAFDPGETARLVTVDGDSAEWGGMEPLIEQDGRKLYAQYDEEGLYLCVTGDVSPDTPLYIPIDTTPKSGSTTFPGAGLRFNRAADFVLRLQGKHGSSSLMVHARYEARRANFFFETTRQDAYVDPPAADNDVFVPILSVLKPLGIQPETPEGQEPPPQNGTMETGLLIHGSADPDSADYNSLADYCYGSGVVEVRIPWGMLNFSNPSAMKIHDDYYEHYGVRSIGIDEMYIGLAQGEGLADMRALQLTGWKQVRVHERKKQSYFVVKQAWGRE